MITQNTAITLDIDTAGVRAEVWAKQDDTGTRKVTASFVNGGSPISLSQASNAELRVLRPDGTMVVSTAEISGNTVVAEFPDNALTVGGEGYGDIRLLDSAGKCISAARFVLHIEYAAVSNEQVTQTSDFTALMQGIYERLGGLSFAMLTEEQYNALSPPEANTVYFVSDGKNITQYLGTAKMSGGALTASTLSAAVNASHGFAASITETEE